MCNPRRVTITATRDVAEAWTCEVRRVAERAAEVTGEARICEALDASVAAPVLDALERQLEAAVNDDGTDGDGKGDSNCDRNDGNDSDGRWRAVGTGDDVCFRRDVEGGYIQYCPADCTLEIVAIMSDEVRGTAEVREQLSGHYAGTVSHRADADYYDDGYGGRTEDVAQREAAELAERGADDVARQQVTEHAEAQAAARGDALQQQANEAAEADLAHNRTQRQRQLQAQAREHLHAVGVRARRAFHQVLALAYRDALMALARVRGAENIRCNEAGDMFEIEFLLPD